MTNPNSIPVTQRISALDGFRGLAILLVTLYRFAEVSFPSEVVGNLPSKAILLGAAGVDFFFVLSGFLISGILLDAKSRPDSYFGRFYLRRSIRIFPLYFASLLACLVVLPLCLGNQTISGEIRGNSLHLWMYTMNLNMAWLNDWCYGSLNHFWSLAVEEQYYLVWPILVFWLSPRNLLRLCLVLLVGFAVARIGFSVAALGSVAEKTFTLFRLDGLLLGSVAAIISRDFPNWRSYLGSYRWSGVLLFVLFASTLPMGSHDYTVRFTIVSGVATALLMSTLASPSSSWENRLLDNWPLKQLGKYSYAMYVFQLPLIPLMSPWLSPVSLSQQLGSPLMAGAAYVGIMLLLTYTAAVISWHCFECWFLELRHCWFRNASLDVINLPTIAAAAGRSKETSNSQNATDHKSSPNFSASSE
jgi:peptidoglycan/LPS O-acetylase OafA/YrhL